MNAEIKSDGNDIGAQLFTLPEMAKHHAVAMMLDRYRELEVELQRNCKELEGIAAAVGQLTDGGRFLWGDKVVEVEFVDVGKGSYKLNFQAYPTLAQVTANQ